MESIRPKRQAPDKEARTKNANQFQIRSIKQVFSSLKQQQMHKDELIYQKNAQQLRTLENLYMQKRALRLQNSPQLTIEKQDPASTIDNDYFEPQKTKYQQILLSGDPEERKSQEQRISDQIKNLFDHNLRDKIVIKNNEYVLMPINCDGSGTEQPVLPAAGDIDSPTAPLIITTGKVEGLRYNQHSGGKQSPSPSSDKIMAKKYRLRKRRPRLMNDLNQSYNLTNSKINKEQQSNQSFEGPTINATLQPLSCTHQSRQKFFKYKTIQRPDFYYRNPNSTNTAKLGASPLQKRINVKSEQITLLSKNNEANHMELPGPNEQETPNSQIQSSRVKRLLQKLDFTSEFQEIRKILSQGVSPKPKPRHTVLPYSKYIQLIQHQ